MIVYKYLRAISAKGSVLGESALSALDNPHDHSKQSQRTPENLNYEYLDKRVGVLSIGDGAA
jgi:hypothetical protein